MYKSKNILSNPQISHYMFTQLQLIHSYFFANARFLVMAKKRNPLQTP